MPSLSQPRIWKKFLFKQPPAASRSNYVSETNVVAKVTDSTINQTPCIAQAKQSVCFPPVPGDGPLSNGQLGLFKTQLIVSVRSEVTPLAVKLKVAVLSIHS
jgi:hypothetical protein